MCLDSQLFRRKRREYLQFKASMGKGKQNPVSKTKTFFFDGTAV
jgi:hypothetical protein